MPKFLDTQAISHELMNVIKEAKEKIILVSPYLKVNPQIQERLKTKSKLGTLAEIVIVYGKSELKQTELEWIKEIDDLKTYEKGNLHAKCYLNEDKAIICSMNLYDYSQQNNIEMGLLISRQNDKEAYESLMEEINNIKVNGTRRRFDALSQQIPVSETPLGQNQDSQKQNSGSSVANERKGLSADQKLKFQILKNWRYQKSREEKIPAYLILTDEEIKSIVTKDRIDGNSLYETLQKKKAIRYNEEILYQLGKSKYYTIGTVVNVWYQDNQNSYDRVKFKLAGAGEERWYETTQELPKTNAEVAVQLNKSWFNDYFYLDV